MNNLLTNDAKYLISVLYKEYLYRRKSGQDRKSSRTFSDEMYIQSELMVEWKTGDVHDAISELLDYEYLDSIPGGNKFFEIVLQPKGIAMMENDFKDKLDEVLNYAQKIKSLVPFI